MSGYGYGGAPPYENPYGNQPPMNPHLPGIYPPLQGAYPPSTGGYPPQSNPGQGYGWYQWQRPPQCAGDFQWVPCQGGIIPPNAVHAGRDQDGGPLYAGRAYLEGDLLPAKVAPSHCQAYVPFGGREHAVQQFEVLVSFHTAWMENSDGRVPQEAIVIGQTSDGENLYMGRTVHDGTLTPGKIQPSHGCLYIPYGGEELKYREYEVLVLS